MNKRRIEAIEAEIHDLNIAICAAEGWAPSYASQPVFFKQLLTLEADMDKLFRDYLRQLSQRVNSYVAWGKYHRDVVAVHASEGNLATLEAYDVNVLFDDEGFSNDEETQIQALIRDVYVNGVSIGYLAERALRTGNDSATITRSVESPIFTAIQESADQHLKQLAQWLDDTTAKEIVQSIQESLALGESQHLAMQRLIRVIDDPARAMRIAQTESVRAFAIGNNNFALRNGASSKTWEALPGADAGSSQTPCLDNDGQTVDILDAFASGDEMNPAHPYCRCKVNYNYPDGSVVEDV